MKRVMILGVDGYLGWTLFHYLKQFDGYEVSGVDNASRRGWVRQVGSESLTPIGSWLERKMDYPELMYLDVTDFEALKRAFRWGCPDVIVHLAEQPSAPYSMRGFEEAERTQVNNTIGTLSVLWAMKEYCPKAHLLKLGTMGEYGTPKIPITEGPIQIHYRGYLDELPFPKQPGSFYHATKCFDTLNIAMACRFWDLRVTDVMQGVVYGMPDFGCMTRFDYDEVFGTVVNRFVVQAVAGIPLTVYGGGGQTRGFLYIMDSMKCLKLAMDTPPRKGQHRIFNQFGELFSIRELALRVSRVFREDEDPIWDWKHIENPRIEQEKHLYLPEAVELKKLGYKPDLLNEAKLKYMLDTIEKYKDRIQEEVIQPRIKWG